VLAHQDRGVHVMQNVACERRDLGQRLGGHRTVSRRMLEKGLRVVFGSGGLLRRASELF
jgi:hypothetical protein